jgi:DNA-binding MarR family transcriptional regulator
MKNNQNIDYLLQHLTSLLARNYDQILDEQLGVGYAQYKILKIIYATPNVKQRYIASMLGQTEASISRQIKLLINLNFLKMTPDRLNRRVHLITLTPRGEKIIEAANEAIERFNGPIFDQLQLKQKKQLFSLLETIDRQICPIEHGSEFVRLLEDA